MCKEKLQGVLVSDVRKIELLKLLAEGCRKHPAYRAKRQVKIDCEPCLIMWEARLELEAEKKLMF